jgi:hypothetical protein
VSEFVLLYTLSRARCFSDAVPACLRQNLYFCTSTASKVSTCVRVLLTCRRRLGFGLLLLAEDAYVSIRPSAYVSCRHVCYEAYVSIRPSAYVSIRQHTSAYVSIRAHTSAYVSSGVRDTFFDSEVICLRQYLYFVPVKQVLLYQ